MFSLKRNQYLINKKLQYGLIKRMFAYWCLTWFLVFTIPLLFNFVLSLATTFDTPSTAKLASQMASVLIFPVVTSVFFLPIAAWDSIRFSNRIAGPMFRFGQTIRQMADSENTTHLVMRDHDYCKELAVELNRLMDTISDLKNSMPQAANTGERQKLESVG
jgi:signal transduction histidine kinase